MYIRELSWDPHFFVLENKSIFIVAGTCANNVQSLKEIDVWADLEPHLSMVPKMFEPLRFDCILCFEVEIWYTTYPDRNLQPCATFALESCPGVGLRVKMYNRWNLGIFYARKLKFGMLLTPRPTPSNGGGRVVRRCCVSYITGASNWYWLAVGQGLLSL